MEELTDKQERGCEGRGQGRGHGGREGRGGMEEKAHATGESSASGTSGWRGRKERAVLIVTVFLRTFSGHSVSFV